MQTRAEGFVIETVADCGLAGWEEGANPGILIRPAGTGTLEGGSPMMLEIVSGRPILHVWADINEEEQTHRIDLSEALETNRREDKD